MEKLKEHLNVGTIGHVDHGKTTLTAALTAVQALRTGGKAVTYDQVAKASEAQGRRDPSKVVTIATAHVEYESAARHYAHVDCPGHADFIKNMIVGAAQMDAAILLVDASQGAQQQTREHILLAKQVGIEHMVVFLNKCDVADPELIDLVQMETEEMLASQGYDPTKVTVIRGAARPAAEAAFAGVLDARTACIEALVAALDAVPSPVRVVDAPFLLPIEGVHSIPGRGTVATGRVARGKVIVGQEVEIVGLLDENAKPRRIVVTGTQAFRKDVPEAAAGMNVGLLLRGVKSDEIQRGQVLAAPNSIQPRSKGQAEFYCLSAKEGGRSTPFGVGYSPQFFFGTTDVTGKVVGIGGAESSGDTAPEASGLVEPGQHRTVHFELGKAVGVEPGMRFALREGGRTVGAGVVTQVS